jgi:hypothetical protein
MFPLRRATFAQRVVIISVGENFFRGPVFVDPNSLDEFPLSPFHFCTMGHFPAGGSQLPPGSTISPSSSLPILGALCGQIADPTPLHQFSDRHHYDLSLVDNLMFLHGLHQSWIKLSFCHFFVGGRLFSAILQDHQLFIECGSQFCLTRFNVFSHSGQHFLFFAVRLRLDGVRRCIRFFHHLLEIFSVSFSAVVSPGHHLFHALSTGDSVGQYFEYLLHLHSRMLLQLCDALLNLVIEQTPTSYNTKCHVYKPVTTS